MEHELQKDSFKVASRLTSLRVYNTGLQQCTPGYRWGPGVRDHHLIHLILGGQGEYTFQGTTFALSRGDLFWAPPDEVITYRAEVDTPWRYCWVGFNGPDANALMQRTDFSIRQPILHLEEIQPAQTLLLDLYQARGSQSRDLARMAGHLYLFLAWLMEIAREGDQSHEPASWEHVRQACAFIANNFSSPIGVADIAAHVGVSRSLLYRAFQAQLSASPAQYLTQFRIQQACMLLERSSLAVKAVAYSVGFEDPLYFSRRFRELMGCTPGEYRAQRHNTNSSY